MGQGGDASFGYYAFNPFAFYIYVLIYSLHFPDPLNAVIMFLSPIIIFLSPAIPSLLIYLGILLRKLVKPKAKAAS